MDTIATKFYAHGKLLITGEYFVLDGAKALAVPTKAGQRLEVFTEGESGKLQWNAYDNEGNLWLQATYTLPDLDLQSEETPESLRLQQILLAAGVLNPEFLALDKAVTVNTYLEFPLNWGLGSSSTLVYNVARWAGIDAHELLKNTFGGSGYDVACAAAKGPIVYQLIKGRPTSVPIDLDTTYQDNLYFVFLGNKQDSREGIARYKSLEKDDFAVYGITVITEILPTFSKLEQVNTFLDRHEQIVADFIGLEKVKDLLFPDFQGSVKSLGAWGGDFVLVSTNLDYEQVKAYFAEHGFETVLTWKEMVL